MSWPVQRAMARLWHGAAADRPGSGRPQLAEEAAVAEAEAEAEAVAVVVQLQERCDR